MIYILILFGLLAAGIIIAAVYRTRERRKRLESLQANWGRAFKQEFPFDKIALYHQLVHQQTEKQSSRTLDPDQIHDLNLHDLFTCLDRTISRCGQQFLYHRLLCPEGEPEILSRWDQAAEFFRAQPAVREKVQLALGDFEKRESYFLPALFFHPPADRAQGIISLLTVALILTVVGGIFIPPFFLLTLGLLGVNLLLHYRMKKKSEEYMSSFKSLPKLFATAEFLHSLELPWLDLPELKKKLKAVAPLRRYLALLSFEPDRSSDLAIFGWLTVEYLKILFLLDLRAYYRSLEYIRGLQAEIRELFALTGFTDSAQSLASFRAGLPYFTVPIFTEEVKQLEVQDLFHPLVEDCVPNSLSIAGRGILITGSNMSGKTTFIRSLAVSALLGQAFATCPARRYRAPRLNICSSIVIADELVSGKSYYFRELERILTLVHRAGENSACLFVIDECFKGTNTLERIAAAREVLAYLNRGPHIVLIATHDIELSQLLQQEYELYHFSEQVTGGSLSFDYSIKPGLLRSRNAIKLLEIEGYPREIVEGARKIADSIAFTGNELSPSEPGDTAG